MPRRAASARSAAAGSGQRQQRGRGLKNRCRGRRLLLGTPARNCWRKAPPSSAAPRAMAPPDDAWTPSSRRRSLQQPRAATSSATSSRRSRLQQARAARAVLSAAWTMVRRTSSSIVLQVVGQPWAERWPAAAAAAAASGCHSGAGRSSYMRSAGQRKGGGRDLETQCSAQHLRALKPVDDLEGPPFRHCSPQANATTSAHRPPPGADDVQPCDAARNTCRVLSTRAPDMQAIRDLCGASSPSMPGLERNQARWSAWTAGSGHCGRRRQAGGGRRRVPLHDARAQGLCASLMAPGAACCWWGQSQLNEGTCTHGTT